MTNLLRNADFRGPTYEPIGQVSKVIASDWLCGWLDNGRLYRVVPAPNAPALFWEKVDARLHGVAVTASQQFIVEQFGTMSKFGPRPIDGMAPCLTPEILVIGSVLPYLDPPRTEPPDQSVTGFKLYGTTFWWLCQQVDVTPGRKYRIGFRAHAWDRANEDPNDPHWSHGAGGTQPFFATEDAPGLSDENRNFRFRAGVDLAGGLDITAVSVQWGLGTHIYNRFQYVPELDFTATGNKVTVILSTDNRYGWVNSNGFIGRPYLEEIVDPVLDEIQIRLAILESWFGEMSRMVNGNDARLTEVENRLNATASAVAQLEPQVFTLGTKVADHEKRIAALEGTPPVTKYVTVTANVGQGKTVGSPDPVLTYTSSLPIQFTGELIRWPGEEEGIYAIALGTLAAEGYHIIFVGATFAITPAIASVTYPHTLTTAGLHIVGGNHDHYGTFLDTIVTAGRPLALIKCFQNGGMLEARDADPRTIRIFRTRPLKDRLGEDNPTGNFLWPSDKTPAIAQEWMEALFTRWQPDRYLTDYLEITNETNCTSEAQFKNENDFYIECMKYATAHGFKIAIGGFSAGCPEPWQVDILAPSFREAALSGHILAVHDGTFTGLLREGATAGTALRHRMIKERMDAKGYPMPAIAITECYFPREFQPDDLRWYLAELAKDSYVLGAAWFTLGDWGSPNQNVAGQLDRLAQVILEMPIRKY